MKKRIKALLLAAALCVSICVSAAYGAGGTKLVLSYPETLPAVGQTFTVVVSITDNPGLCAAQFTLKSGSAVQCVSADIGSVLSGALAASNPAAPDGAIIAAASSTALKGDGPLGVFTFRVLSAGDAKFSLSDVVLTGSDGKAISYTAETAALTSSTNTSTGASGTGTGGSGSASAAAKTFTDVGKSHWAYSYIQSAAADGLFTGYPDGTFRPDANVTRSQFITVLWRAAGSPAPAKAAPFTDLGSETAYYRDAVSWGWEKGYVTGTKAADGTYYFDPNGNITRQQAMAILYRYGGSVSGGELLLTGVYKQQFTDSGSIAAYAENAVWWSVYNGYIGGTTATTLSPNGYATRAQLAKILTIYLEDTKG